MAKKTVLNEHAIAFASRIKSAPNSLHERTELILDSNVIGEFYSLSDLLKLPQGTTPEQALRSERVRYRQRRSRSSLVLSWWLAQNRVPTGFLGAEGIHILTEKLSPRDQPLMYAMTMAIVHIVRPMVMRDSHLGALIEVDHTTTGDRADDEILRAASEDRLPVITWEGFQTDGSFSSDPKKLRNRCIAQGIPTHTPEEFLELRGIDPRVEAESFIRACENASWIAQWEGVLPGRKDVDRLIALYRFILFDETNAEFTGVRRPPLRPEKVSFTP